MKRSHQKYLHTNIFPIPYHNISAEGNMREQ